MLAQRLEDRDDTPAEDRIVVLRGAAWADYERISALRGESSVPKLAYLEGDLQLMSPSQDHEQISYLIGRLMEVWCLERGIEFSGYGSWTVKKKSARGGVEPDECYVFGEITGKPKRPDLAIEVVWTSGGLDKLEIYRRLGVREVWIWRKGHLAVHALGASGYRELSRSKLLPGIDLDELVSFLDRPTASQAIRAYRAALQHT